MDEFNKLLWARLDKMESKQDEIIDRVGQQETELVERVGNVEKSVAAIEGEIKGLTRAIEAGQTSIEVIATSQDQSAGPTDNSVKTENTITAGGNVQGVNAQSDGGVKNIAGQVRAIWEQNKLTVIAAVGVAAVMFQTEIKRFLGIE